MPVVYHSMLLPAFREFLASGWRLSPTDADHPHLWFTPAPPVGMDMNEVVLVLDPRSFADRLIKRGSRGWRTTAPNETLVLGPEAVERVLVADEHLIPGIQALLPSLRVVPLEMEAKIALHDYAHDPAVMFDLEAAPTAGDQGDKLCPGGRRNCIDGLHTHPQGEDGPARAHPAIVKGKPGDIGPPHFFRNEPHAPNSRSLAKTDPSGYHGQHTPKGAKVQLAARENVCEVCGLPKPAGVATCLMYRHHPKVAEAAFDSTIKNTDLMRTAMGLAQAAKQRPLKPDVIRRFVERLVYALEVCTLGVLDRADAMRFSQMLRGAVASIEDGIEPAHGRVESAAPPRSVIVCSWCHIPHAVEESCPGCIEVGERLQKPLAQLRGLVVDSTSELTRDGQKYRGRDGGLRSPRDDRPRSARAPGAPRDRGH